MIDLILPDCWRVPLNHSTEVCMSCYIRHLSAILEENGIAVKKENRTAIDRAIHEFVRVDYKDCPETWKLVKKNIRENPKELKRLIQYLQKRITGI